MISPAVKSPSTNNFDGKDVLGHFSDILIGKRSEEGYGDSFTDGPGTSL
jgi:hypothetical protein